MRLQGRNVEGETKDSTDGHGWGDGDAGLDAEGEQQIKFLTVRNLIRAWAVTAYYFHGPFLEWWTGGIDRRAIKAKALQEATEATESESGASFVGGTGHRPTGVELRDFLVSEDAAMRQLRRSGLFVANGSHPANRPVGRHLRLRCRSYGALFFCRSLSINMPPHKGAGKGAPAP